MKQLVEDIAPGRKRQIQVNEVYVVMEMARASREEASRLRKRKSAHLGRLSSHICRDLRSEMFREAVRAAEARAKAQRREPDAGPTSSVATKAAWPVSPVHLPVEADVRRKLR